MGTDDLHWLEITELAKLIQLRRVSPVEVEEAMLRFAGVSECAAAEVAVRADARVIACFYASADPLDEAALGAGLSTAGGPPVDLIVRTSGEQRLSNFLLWEAAYAELIYQDVLWPDYGPEALGLAVDEFRGRDRRFGAIAARPVLAAG